MAAITHLNSNSTSGNSDNYVTGSFTANAVGDLLVGLVTASGTVSTGVMTDSSGRTYTKITHANFNADANRVYAFVANQLATSTSATFTVTFNSTGDAATGSNIFTFAVSGMTRVGINAIKQFQTAVNQAAGGTPSLVFSNNASSSNPTVGLVGNGTNPAGLTPPTNWTEQADVGYNTPISGGEYVSRDNTFNGTTITWGGTSASAFGAITLELDTSELHTEFDSMPRPVNLRSY